MCSELYPNLYRDETALRLINQIDYDFSLLSKKSKSLMQQFGFLEAAMRQNDLAWEICHIYKDRSGPGAAPIAPIDSSSADTVQTNWYQYNP